MSNMKRFLVVSLGLALAVVVFLWLRSGSESDQDTLFERSDLTRGDIVQIVSAVGSVRALNTVEVGSQLSGQVAELAVDFNDEVRAGDLLARIDPQTFERRVQEAEANLAVARANVEIQRANIDKAGVLAANAERDFNRQQSLVGRGSVSESALELAEATATNARADIDIARAQLRNAQATVLQREAALEAARIDLDRTSIRSPINGVVINRAVDLGQTVAASLQAPVLFSIAQDLSSIRIEASVDEADIGSVSEAAEVRFRVDAFPDQEFNGTVSQVRLAPNEAQNVVTYTVIINADNPSRQLLPGMTASIDIVTGRRSGVLRVDNAAARLRPPEALIIEAPGESSSPRGGRNPGEEMANVLREMGLEADLIARIQDDLREGFGSLRGLFMSGADRDTIQARIATMTQEVLSRHLDAEQVAAFTALQRAMQATRPGVLYTSTPDGRLQAQRVRFGISDDRHTEVISDQMSEGQAVVSRIRRVARD